MRRWRCILDQDMESERGTTRNGHNRKTTVLTDKWIDATGGAARSAGNVRVHQRLAVVRQTPVQMILAVVGEQPGRGNEGEACIQFPFHSALALPMKVLNLHQPFEYLVPVPRCPISRDTGPTVGRWNTGPGPAGSFPR